MRRPFSQPTLVMVLLLASCPRKPLPPDTLVLLIESPPETLDRRLALSAIAENVVGLIEPGLLRIDSDGRPVPDLAESFRQVDALTYEATLRPGLLFHDGTPLTAADVVATFDTLRDPGLHSPLAGRYEDLASVIAPDPLRVRFTLRRAMASFPVELMLGIVPALGAASLEHQEFGKHPVGAGPFRFVEWPDDEHLLLVANPTYYGGEPAVGHLLVKTVRDETTRVLELMHGKADVAINNVSPPLLEQLAHSPGLTLLSTPGANAAYLMFQLNDPKVSDVRVRRAIGEALDREAIARYKFKGHAHVATTLMPPGNWARADDLAPLPYNPKDAVRLLDEAGLTPDPSGIRLALDYRTSTDRFRKSIGLVLVDQLSRVGIDVHLSSLEFGTFFSDIRKGNFELATLKWVPIIDPDLYTLLFASQSIPTPENSYNGANRGHYRNPEVDALLEQARAETSETARRERYHQVQVDLARDLPYVVLWYEDSSAVVRKDLQGFKLSPFGFFSSLAQVRREGAAQ